MILYVVQLEEGSEGEEAWRRGNRFFKSIGLGFKTPREAIEGTFSFTNLVGKFFVLIFKLLSSINGYLNGYWLLPGSTIVELHTLILYIRIMSILL